MRLIDPIKDIKEAFESNNYFTAFALAVSYFEFEANLILGALFENRIKLEKIGKWGLQTKIRLLFGLDMIDRATHNKIGEMIKIRNKLVHPIDIWEKERLRDIFLRYRLTEEEKATLLSFKECYAKLMKAHSRALAEKSKKQ